MTSTKPRPPQVKSFETLLVDLLRSSEELQTLKKTGSKDDPERKWLFSPGHFFDKWFREHGQAYFFLFRKNLKVTNIQFAELLSLIQAHNKSKETGEPIHDLQFLSVTDFYAAIKDIVDSFPRRHKNPKKRYELISKMYYSLLSRHVAVDYFFGSCAVFLPPNLDIDLPLVCAHSGYIHSCGLNVFTRKIDKAKKEKFFGALERHLGRTQGGRAPLFFMVYAHEDFTKGERPSKKEYLRDGLDDVKIHIEKFYMDAERLVDVVEDMKTRFKGRLVLTPPGKKPSQAKRENQECDQTRMLWLLVDHSIREDVLRRGEDRFYICYEQLYLNESPFQLFDENKPAWLSHTTIPHTLLSAMINLTSLSRARNQGYILSDPFVGTGTTWLEAAKIPNVIPRCTDKTPFARLMTEDNLGFFCLKAKELRRYREELDVVIRYLQAPNPSGLDSASIGIVSDYTWAIKFYNSLVRNRRDYSSALEDARKVERLRNESLLRRLLLYLTLRTIARSSAEIRHGSQEWDFAFAIQAQHFVGQIDLLLDLREAEEQHITKIGKFSIFQGVYSKSCTIDPAVLEALKKSVEKEATSGESINSVGIFDVRASSSSDASSIKPLSCDVIITDPPYGFNTDDDLQSLAELYSDAIEKMILALKQDGDLVLCLLDRSHTGRRSPFFTHKELITQQVLSLAERATPKREIIVPAYAVPKQRELFRAPYYWESERALRRAILHFKVRIAGS